jgi:hypothetical protein
MSFFGIMSGFESLFAWLKRVDKKQQGGDQAAEGNREKRESRR